MTDREKLIEAEARRIALEYDLDPDDARLGYPAWQIDWIIEAASAIVTRRDAHGEAAAKDGE